MLQYLYNETGAAAQEIVEKVAPEVNAVSKEEIKEAATERAEEIAADVAKADETITQDQHSAIVEACSQVIYAQVCSELARIQANGNMESLFSEEVVEEYYTGEGKKKKDRTALKWGAAGAGGGAVAGASGGAVLGLVAHGLTGKNSARDQLSIKGYKYGTPEWREAYRKIRNDRAKKFAKRGAIAGGTAGAVGGAVAGTVVGKTKKVLRDFEA